MGGGRVCGGWLEIDLAALCAACGAVFVERAAVRIDSVGRHIELSDGTKLSYSVASIDVGSTSAELGLPGIAERALATRPIAAFADGLEGLLAGCAGGAGAPLRVAVVGGGAGGVELAGASLVLADGRRVPADAWVWVTGAAAPAWLRRSGLETDARGFVRVLPTLQTLDAPSLFAVGDAASLTHAPETPRAGVYPVRQGPVLSANLRAFLAGRTLGVYRPQRDFLRLLNWGDGSALATRWGLAVEGRWVRRWKDRIDRRFVERFQADSPPPPSSDEEPE